VRRLITTVAPALAGLVFAAPALADGGGEEMTRLNLAHRVATTPAPPLGTYVHTFGELMLGKGLRTNNPYRLGSMDPVAFTATYLDLGLGVAFGAPGSLQHGAEFSLLAATDGIAQETIDFSYLALLPVGAHALLRGRAGIPVVLNPDATMGFELGVGAAWLVTGGIGVSSELIGSLFYGAGTLDRSTTTTPVIALQLGAWFEYEVLP
jgi:hypothetical protein